MAILQYSTIQSHYVKIGNISLTLHVKMGILTFMLLSIISFVLRISLIVVFWFFLWKFIEPRTLRMRLLRAALLVLGYACVLATLKITGQ